MDTHSPKSGSVECSTCSSGSVCYHGGCDFCTLCPSGTYSTKLNKTCEDCPEKPVNSFYVGDGLASISQCEYHCRQGFVGVKCLPPLDILVNSLGGPAAAIAVICTILLSPVCLAYLFFKVYRNPVVVPPKLSGVRRLAHSTDGSRSVLVFGGAGVLGNTNNDDRVDNETSVATASPRSKGSLFQSENLGQLSSPLLFSPKTPSGGESEAGLKRRDAEASVSMTWNELGNHALRIYACGSNRPDDDLLFPRDLPADAEGLISPELYHSLLLHSTPSYPGRRLLRITYTGLSPGWDVLDESCSLSVRGGDAFREPGISSPLTIIR